MRCPALFLRAAPHTLHACTPHTLHVPRPQSSAHSPSDVAFSGRACSAQATVIRRTSAPALRWSTCDFWRELRRLAALCLPCTTKLPAITRTHIALMDSSFGDGAQKPLRRVVCDWERLSRCGLAIPGIKVDSAERTLGEGCRSSVTAANVHPAQRETSQSELCVGPAVCAP